MKEGEMRKAIKDALIAWATDASPISLEERLVQLLKPLMQEDK